MTRFRSFQRLHSAFIAAGLLAALLAAACGGGGGNNSSLPPPTSLSLSVTAASSTVNAWGTDALYATVAGGSGNAAVLWSIPGSSPGTLSSVTGLSTTYTAPGGVSAPTDVTITAAAVDSTGSAVGTVTVTVEPPSNDGAAVSVIMTTDDQTQLMAPQAGIHFSTATATGSVVAVDETQTYQQVEGFGAAFTDSAAYLLNQVAEPAQLTSSLNDLFTRNGQGIGLSFMRNPMGASDLARSVYSFDDNGAVAGVGGSPDPTLQNFSIAHDQADIIPIIQQALQLNPQLKIMANPWSPPAWMKNPPSGQTTPTMNGGTLNPNYYDAFANYFVKYLQAYAAAGIPVQYISMQNEPLYDTSTNPSPYPGMVMDAATQATVLNQYLLPAFSNNQIAAKVLVYDFNWDTPSYPETVLSSTPAANLSQIAGVAWHGYGGTPGAMTALFNLYPALGEYQTEHSGGTWVTDQVRSDFEEIIQVMRNYGSGYVKWSLALDENYGPHTGGCSTCTPIVTVNSSTGAVTRDVEYYTLGQFSKYILPGARRIYSTNAQGIVSAAFVNPDQSKVLVAYNDSALSRTFSVQWGSRAFAYTLPALAGATFTWNGTQSSGAPPYTLSAAQQIQASSYNSVSGLETEASTDTDGGYDLGYANGGSFAVYRYVDFGSGESNVVARLACDPANGGNCGGTLEFHLDSASGPLAGSVTIPSTGGWQTWTTVFGQVSGASGVHDLYVVFKAPTSGNTSLGNLNWFRFD